MHGYTVKDPSRIIKMVQKDRQVNGYCPIPVIINADDHFKFDISMNNYVAAVRQFASWGYYDCCMKEERRQ
jgi:hypothetical protein